MACIVNHFRRAYLCQFYWVGSSVQLSSNATNIVWAALAVTEYIAAVEHDDPGDSHCHSNPVLGSFHLDVLRFPISNSFSVLVLEPFACSSGDFLEPRCSIPLSQ